MKVAVLFYIFSSGVVSILLNCTNNFRYSSSVTLSRHNMSRLLSVRVSMTPMYAVLKDENLTRHLLPW